MALSGVHVSFGYAGAGKAADINSTYTTSYAIRNKSTSSQTLTANGTTTVVAPLKDSMLGLPIVTIAASADCYYAIGDTPDASVTTSNTSNNARDILRSGETVSMYVSPNDKVAIILA